MSRIDNPEHYDLDPKPIDVIEKWEMGFLDGNVLKYLARYRSKGSPIEDLKKARWYLDRLINSLEREFEEKHKGKQQR